MKTNPLKILCKLATLAFVAGTLSTAMASSPAVPYVMTTGNYLETFTSIGTWTDNFGSGVGSAPWSGCLTNLQTPVGIPNGTNITTATTNWQAITSGSSGIERGTNAGPTNLVFVCSGTTDNTAAIAVDLFLDFTATNTGTLSFDWAELNNSTGNRGSTLHVYTSTNGGVTFAELTAALVIVSNNVASSGTVSVALPGTFSNCPTAQIRFYQHNGPNPPTGGTGSRAKITIDNVAVVSTPTGGPQAPVITGIAPIGITNSVNTAASFTVTATASPAPTYFWFKEIPGTSTNLIPTATTATLSFPSAATTNSANYQVIVSNTVAPFTATSSVVTLLITDAPPSIVSITPASLTNTAGSAASFTVTATGSAPLGYFWYKEIPGTSTNLIPTATTAVLSFAATAVSDTASYQVVVSNSIAPFVATSSVVSLVVTAAPPVITGIGPTPQTQNAGLDAAFTVTNTGTPPLTYLWYKGSVPVPGSEISISTNSLLRLFNLTGNDAGSYVVVVTNNSGSITGSPVALTVTNDPHITYEPNNTYGLLKGVVQFQVAIAGATPTYTWYYTDLSGNQIAQVADGTLASGSIISGSGSSTLTWSNLQSAELLTNFVVVAANGFGAVTSSVASLLTVNNTNTLVFWDFNGLEFTNTVNNTNAFIHPTPFIGVGTASVLGTALIPPTSPFAGSVDANNGLGFMSYPVGAYPNGYPDHAPPFSWGTSTYPTNGNPANNKTTGVQYNVSTVGAKNIQFSYEARTSATASRYYRLEYTTNQTDWVEYPASTSFGTVSVTYVPFAFNLTGIPGVMNNPNFGVRLLAEFQSTATYGISPTNSYVGVANNYGTGGTLTYDLVTFTGDAVTNNNTPPTVSTMTNVNMVDYAPYTNSFTVSDDSTAPDSLQYSAVSLNPSGFNATFTFEGSGANRRIIINPASIVQTVAAAPILVTVTDANGDSTVTWFTANVGTVNLPPTNSLISLGTTNVLVNKPITIQFPVSDDRTPASGLTYSVSSGNSTLVPNDTVNNLIINNAGTATPSLTIVPAANQLGEGTITLTVSDNDTQAPKSTSATFALMVRPNTNIIGIDYFTYDSSGALDGVSGGYWKQISGPFGTMAVASSSSGGVVTLDSLNRTENAQALLLGSPYSTNGAAVLYASYIVNMDSTIMPRFNGSYFTMFNDASGNTANIEGAVVAATNGAAPGFYRLGINNRTGAVGTNSQMVAVDLLPESNYVVVVSLVVSNGVSTLWVNPNSTNSPSVTDTSALTAKFNIGAFEFRESGANAGSARISKLKVGTSFDSVFPSLHPRLAGSKVVLDSSDSTIDIESTPDLLLPFTDLGVTTPYTNTPSGIQFFRFKK
ncbi:MAG TPA: immunoglobulin domain-containing protein [Candidatus Acidoferrales bacterium]|jgi:hypothetical protein|nr:immunoglobulin domain-containing protein [Candidatus Acidoferrales bacterium]